MPSKIEIFDGLVESYSKNPEQGLKFCKKKLQKNPNDSTHLLAQAAFLSELDRPNDALAICDAIKASPKEPLEPGIIISLQNIVRDCQEELGTFTGIGGPRLSAFWKDALDNCPKSWLKETRSEMLSSAVRSGYWDTAQQLFARLQREFPQNPKFHFAWIALCQIQADKLPAGDKMGPSLKMLASRSLQAIVGNTIMKKDTTRKLTAPADLRLLYQIYNKQGLLSELLEVLNSPDIGISSDVGKNDIEFVLIKMNAMSELKQWIELRKLCLGGIERLCQHYETAGRITADVPNKLAWAVAWQPWRTALNITLEAAVSGSADDILMLAERYLRVDSQHRNAGNAVLLYRYLFDKPQLEAACRQFFDWHASRVSCFDDLRQVVEGLDTTQRDEFCKYLSNVGSATPEAGTDEKTLLKRLVSKINALKLRYLLQYSQAQEGSDAEIVAFIAECLNVYSLMAEKEDGPSDDACILAVSVLIKLGSTTSSIYNLQAACLAQLLRDNSQYNFNATLLQLLNARILGLGSIAIAAFHDLNLREVQYDTLGHLLYTRIITLHPFAVSLKDVRALEDRYKNPKSSIIFATQFPRRATDATLDTLTKDLENVFFDKLHEFITFNERVSRSYSSMQSRLELQRMKRLTDDDSISMSSYIPKSYVFKSHDNRDFGVLVDFETAKASANFRTIATGGYKPKTYWAVRWQVNELVPALLSLKSTSLTETQNRTMDQLLGYLKDNIEAQDAELTPNERDICQRWDKLIPIAIWLILGPKHQHASRNIKQDLTSLTEYLKTATLATQAQDMDIGNDDRLEFTHFSELESWFLHLEFAKTCVMFGATATTLLKQKGHHAAGNVSADVVNKIKAEAKALGGVVQKHARTLQSGLKKDGKQKVLAVVKGGGLGALIEQLASGEQLRRYVDEMVESAIEGLDGVLKVKVG